MRTISPKALVVWDLDNTLTDSATFWGVATEIAVQMTIDAFGLDQQKVHDAVRRAPGQYRFSDFRQLLRWLGDEKILPKNHDPADPQGTLIRVTHWAIRDAWFKKQREMTRFYPGALGTLQTIKAQKTDLAIYTDTEASSLIRRFWLMADNARRDGHVKDTLEVLDLFGHFYAQPSIESDYETLKDVDTDFVLAMKQRMSLFKPDAATGKRLAKPNGPHLQKIMQDFGASPGSVLMLGDTDKDGGSARASGVDFGWIRFGAVLDDAVVRTAKIMADPGYKFGLNAVKQAFREQAIAPAIILRRDHSELLRKASFIPGKGFQTPPGTAPVGSSCLHTGACPQGQTADQIVHRLGASFRSQVPLLPTGPATHFQPEPPDFLP